MDHTALSSEIQFNTGRLLCNCRNVHITGGSFVNSTVVGDIYGLHGWSILSQNVSYDVFHDSACRHDAPRCTDTAHEHTRTMIMNLITEDITPRSRLIWVHGSSHTSCVAQTIADSCTSIDDSPTTFFFSDTDNTQKSIRNTALNFQRARGHRSKESYNYYQSFIPTIAYQLCIRIEAIRFKVSRVVERDPAIMSRDITSQLRELVLAPFSVLVDETTALPTRPLRLPVMLIDAPHILTPSQQLSLSRVILDIVEGGLFSVSVVVFSNGSSPIGQVLKSYDGPANITRVKVPRGRLHMNLCPWRKALASTKAYFKS